MTGSASGAIRMLTFAEGPGDQMLAEAAMTRIDADHGHGRFCPQAPTDRSGAGRSTPASTPAISRNVSSGISCIPDADDRRPFTARFPGIMECCQYLDEGNQGIGVPPPECSECTA